MKNYSRSGCATVFIDIENVFSVTRSETNALLARKLSLNPLYRSRFILSPVQV
jgi:hypothetical protein